MPGSAYYARVFSSMVVGTDGSETASEAVRQAAELAQKVGAKVHLVSAYEPVPEGRLREERQQVPGDLQWMVNPREDVSETLEQAAGRLRDPRRRRGGARRPDRGRQQGHDRSQALPARQRPEQGLASRSLQRDDHPDNIDRPEGDLRHQTCGRDARRGTHQAPQRSAAAASARPAP
jgi:nucleotide-binding universal stress UspA family protein